MSARMKERWKALHPFDPLFKACPTGVGNDWYAEFAGNINDYDNILGGTGVHNNPVRCDFKLKDM